LLELENVCGVPEEGEAGGSVGPLGMQGAKFAGPAAGANHEECAPDSLRPMATIHWPLPRIA